jgi:hypothetical protein
MLRVRQGDRREGLPLLERAAAAGLDIESVQFEYGWALATEEVFDAARAQQARAAFERAIRASAWLSGGNPDAGLCLWAHG